MKNNLYKILRSKGYTSRECEFALNRYKGRMFREEVRDWNKITQNNFLNCLTQKPSLHIVFKNNIDTKIPRTRMSVAHFEKESSR